MTAARLPDWLERLNAYLMAVRAQPYDPATHHCGTFILGAVSAITGETVQEIAARCGVAEIPDTALGAARVIVERGDMRGLAEAYFGKPANPAKLLARRGDIALLDGRSGDTLGVVESGGVLVLTEAGLWHRPLREARGFWKLG